MPFEVLVALSLLTVALSVAVGLALVRGRSLDTLQEALEVSKPADLMPAVRGLQDDLASSRFVSRRTTDDVDRLVEQLEAGVVRLDDELTVVTINRAARQLLGLRTTATAGRSAMETFVDHRLEQVARTAREMGSASGELALHDPVDRTVVVRARRAAPGGIWLVLEDVSELRRLQRMRTEVIDNLAHELRTPLTTVRLLTETLGRDLEGIEVPARVRDRIQKMDVETEHLVQMVNELLDLARMEGGDTRPLVNEVDMAGVIRRAVDRLRAFAERNAVGLTTDVPTDGGLPRVLGDQERLGQLMINLLHNAVKFSRERTDIVVRAAPHDGEVVVSVRDQGYGIPRSDLERIFERFYKVDKARVRGQAGTGLGLAIARHIVEGHGGRIWAESEEGSGSTFSFAIPIVNGERE